MTTQIDRPLDARTLAALAAVRVKHREAQKHAPPLDPIAFARLLGIEPDPWQATALCSASKRSLWNISRQMGKSTTAAILALHTAIYKPAALVLLVSPSLRQSVEIFRKVRDLAARLPQPPDMDEDTKTSATFANGSRIVSLPSSEATIRGYSAVDLAIFDEAARVEDPLYHAVTPMLAVSNGALLAMSTPWGKQGWWAEAWHGAGTWERVTVTAYECTRISAAFLEEERATMGDWWFSQEYLCEFREAEDNVFSHAEIRAALDDSIEPLFGGAL